MDALATVILQGANDYPQILKQQVEASLKVNYLFHQVSTSNIHTKYTLHRTADFENGLNSIDLAAIASIQKKAALSILNIEHRSAKVNLTKIIATVSKFHDELHYKTMKLLDQLHPTPTPLELQDTPIGSNIRATNRTKAVEYCTTKLEQTQTLCENLRLAAVVTEMERNDLLQNTLKKEQLALRNLETQRHAFLNNPVATMAKLLTDLNDKSAREATLKELSNNGIETKIIDTMLLVLKDNPELLRIAEKIKKGNISKRQKRRLNDNNRDNSSFR